MSYFTTILRNAFIAIFVGAALFPANTMAESIQISDQNGLKLNANLVLADGASIAGDIVLITHGTLAHNKMEIIVAMQDLLAERGISSLAPTLSLGVSDRSGMYDCAVPHTHKHSDAMLEIGQWLEWLQTKGAKNVILAGHSRGGNQTAWFAAREPNPIVSKVILVAPATYDAKKAAQGFEKNHKRPLAGAMTEAKAMIDGGNGQKFMKGVGVLYCPGADVRAESFVDYYENDDRRHTPNLMAMIGKPVLVIAGSEDTVVEGLIDATKPLVDAGRVEMVIVDGAGHFFRDLYAEDMADAMEEFINR